MTVPTAVSMWRDYNSPANDPILRAVNVIIRKEKIGGRDAVRVILAHERPVIIGSDEAARLKAAIDARIAARQR